jgi:hypothetical protein
VLVEKCLDPDEKPAELMSLWNVDPKRKETGKEPLKELPFAFIFKKKIFLRDDEKELQDPIAKLYVYSQVMTTTTLIVSLFHNWKCECAQTKCFLFFGETLRKLPIVTPIITNASTTNVNRFLNYFMCIQALSSVIDSELPCSIEDAVKLAALQCQITYGDHKATTHVVGFLT